MKAHFASEIGILSVDYAHRVSRLRSDLAAILQAQERLRTNKAPLYAPPKETRDVRLRTGRYN